MAGRKPKVYSDRYPLARLRKIQRAITVDFYYSAHMLRSVLASRIIKAHHLWSAMRSEAVLLATTLLTRRLLARLRPVGGVRFLLLRDRAGMAQVVLPSHVALGDINCEWVISVNGERQRESRAPSYESLLSGEMLTRTSLKTEAQ